MAEKLSSANFCKLCTLTLFHEYVGGQLHADDFVMQLTPAMQQLCRNEGLLVRATAEGIVVLYELDETPVDQIDELRLNIGIQFIDPDFFRFSGAGLHPLGSVLLCSNDISQPADGVDWLHSGAFVDEKQLKPVGQLGVDAYTDGVGLVVSLNLKALITEANANKKPAVLPLAHYGIQFSAREVPWLYWFWLKQGKLKNLIEKDSDFSRLDVRLADDTAITFDALDEVVSMQQQRGIRFVSSVPLKLGASSNFTLSLHYQDDMGKKVLIEELPHPAKDCLELLVVEQEKKVVAASHVSL